MNVLVIKIVKDVKFLWSLVLRELFFFAKSFWKFLITQFIKSAVCFGNTLSK
jgi:hypothetical protein